MRLYFCVLFALVSLFHTDLRACARHPDHSAKTVAAAKKNLEDYWVGPAVSGSWFDPARNGEGIILQYLPDGRVLAIWFTYPAVGERAEQAWMLGTGVASAEKIRFSSVVQPKGGKFGAQFNPASVRNEPWGTFELTFTSCNQLTMRYEGTSAYGSGTRSYTRLSTIDQIDCSGARKLTTHGARSIDGLRGKSGAWYVPSRSGEGWIIEELADNRIIVFWFTFTPEGEQAWIVGSGVRAGNLVQIDDSQITRGSRFGEAFNAANVVRNRWGTLRLSFVDCNALQVNYTSSLSDYASGTRDAVRLATVAGTHCVDGTPLAALNGQWREVSAMLPGAQSELAVTSWNGQLYALGGYGDARGFKRFDPASNSWTRLPDMPAGRDHLSAFALDGGIYFSGGFTNGGGDQSISAFRFDLARGVWEPRAEIPFSVASGAATLFGRAYIASEDGSLLEYDALSRKTRRIESAPNNIARDHSNLVAYLGELWLIAGRFPETATTAIYDPVSNNWRAGPKIFNRRGGFAAAVVSDQIIISGGEVLGDSAAQLAYVEASTEVLAIGADFWQVAARQPLPSHGVSGTSINGQFFLVGGSTVAGSVSNRSGRVFALTLIR
jgi:Kelch motif